MPLGSGARLGPYEVAAALAQARWARCTTHGAYERLEDNVATNADGYQQISVSPCLRGS